MSDDKATDLKSMVRNKRKTIKIAAAGPPQTRSPNPEPPTANTPTKTLAPPNKARFMQEPKDTNNTTATAPSHTLANETTTSSQPTTKYPHNLKPHPLAPPQASFQKSTYAPPRTIQNTTSSRRAKRRTRHATRSPTVLTSIPSSRLWPRRRVWGTGSLAKWV
jgi:hypothetical protein